MSDPISTTASTLDIIGRIASAAQWIWQHLRRVDTARSVEPLSVELRPLGFTVDLSQQIPRLEMEFYAINFLGHPVRLVDAKVGRLSFGGVAIDGIALSPHHEGVVLVPHSSRLVTCVRTLADAEARALATISGRTSGAYALTARAQHRRREYAYGPVASKAIDGWVQGLLPNIHTLNATSRG